MMQSRDQLRPIGAFASLDLTIFLQQLPAAAVQEIGHQLALRFEAEAALALLFGRHPDVRNELAGGYMKSPRRTLGRYITLPAGIARASNSCWAKGEGRLAPSQRSLEEPRCGGVFRALPAMENSRYWARRLAP